jgi:hypothetical protein
MVKSLLAQPYPKTKFQLSDLYKLFGLWERLSSRELTSFQQQLIAAGKPLTPLNGIYRLLQLN